MVMVLSDCRPGAPTRLFATVLNGPPPSAQRTETLEKQAFPRTSVFVTVCSHSIPAVRFVGIFVGIGRTNVHGDFRYSERRELSRWPARTMARAPTPSRSGPT